MENDKEKFKIIEKLNARIQALSQHEELNSDEIPMTLQMKAYLYDFSLEDKSITIAFPVQKKQLNPNKSMVGGLIANAADMTCGLLMFALDGSSIAPTITMTTNFLNPIFENDTLLMTATIETWGKRIVNMSARGISKENGKSIVAATASFISPESFKKH